MPKPPSVQAAATIQTGIPSSSASGTRPMAAARKAMPRPISRSRYGSRRGRLWTYEPSAQVRPPPVRESPARVADRPRWVTSISGMKLSAATSAPAARPRIRTTEGSPRADRNVPRGSRRTMAGTSRTAPTAAGSSAVRSGCWPAYWSRQAPAATASASSERRLPRMCRAPPSFPGSVRGSVRSAGSMTASGSSIRTGMERKTQRQPRCSVTVPETSGPTITGTTQAAENDAITAGRSRSG